MLSPSHNALVRLSQQPGMQISSALSQLLNLHNLSEEVSQAQHERAVRMGEVWTPVYFKHAFWTS